MVELVVFLFAAIGMAHIMVDGSVFNSFKAWLATPSKWGYFGWANSVITWSKNKLLSLMNCYQCSGFWAGLFVGLFMWANGSDPLAAHGWSVSSVMFVYACVGSYASTLAANILIWLQRT